MMILKINDIDCFLDPTSDNRRGWATYYYFRKRKDGSIGKTLYLYLAYFTPLRECVKCKNLSTPKHTHYRAFGNSNDFEHGYFCVSCWNKRKNFKKLENEYLEIRKLIRQIKREITKK